MSNINNTYMSLQLAITISILARADNDDDAREGKYDDYTILYTGIGFFIILLAAICFSVVKPCLEQSRRNCEGSNGFWLNSGDIHNPYRTSQATQEDGANDVNEPLVTNGAYTENTACPM